MKKQFLRRSLCYIISAVIIIICIPYTNTLAAVEQLLRIGLYYGTNALPTANLANETGSGYSYGFFDSADNFIEVGSTWREKITIAKDKVLFLAGNAYYDVKPSSVEAQIGAYHIELPGTYTDYSEALSVSSQYDGTGTAGFAFPAYINGAYVVRLDSYATSQEASSALAAYPSGSAVVGQSQTCYTVLATGLQKIVFEFDAGTTCSFAVQPLAAGGLKASTWFKGYKYYGAFEYKRLYGNDITVINAVRAEDYVTGVIPYEMSASWPIEALKAQAVCARTYAVCNLNKHKNSGFDLCNTTDCQVYYGVYTGALSDVVEEACRATSGLCVYYNDKLATTYYCSSDGGYTESAKNVWGNDVPHLQAVADPYETLTVANKGIWSVTYTLSELTWILQNKGYSCSNIINCYVKSRTAAGNVYEVVMVDATGKELTFTGGNAYTIFYSATLGKAANSLRYTISGGSGGPVSDVYIKDKSGSAAKKDSMFVIGAEGTTVEIKTEGANVISSSGTRPLGGSAGTSGSNGASITLNGTGWGHNVGMSQYGAKGMAEQGFTYDQIINYYFTGVYIA